LNETPTILWKSARSRRLGDLHTNGEYWQKIPARKIIRSERSNLADMPPSHPA
jgi:hypothetical protein